MEELDASYIYLHLAKREVHASESVVPEPEFKKMGRDCKFITAKWLPRIFETSWTILSSETQS